jgi:hypothetical protein
MWGYIFRHSTAFDALDMPSRELSVMRLKLIKEIELSIPFITVILVFKIVAQ